MTHVLRIEGGRPLKGNVTVSGAKNAVPKNMVAALLADEPCEIHGVPEIQDVEIVTDMLRAMGAAVERDGDSVWIDSRAASPLEVADLYNFSGRSRIPVLLCGPLLHRFGEAAVPSLGGCDIGKRPIDFHIAVLEQLGATVEHDEHFVRLSVDHLTGNKIRLDYPSVGATEQVLLAAVTAEGVTELSNAAIEPEIIDLIALLQKMGAIISVAPDRVIRIVGVSRLSGFHHAAIPDRLEVASWACAAITTDGRIFVRHARQHDLMTFLNMYRRIGGGFDVRDDGIEFWRESDICALPLETDVHPGFMTDWQPPFVVALTQANGVSIVHETVYENRFVYVAALNAMGAKVELHRECLGSSFCRFGQRNFLHSAVIAGPTPLNGCDESASPTCEAAFRTSSRRSSRTGSPGCGTRI